MMAIEQGDDIVVIDAGLMFPDEQMLGIDIVIPDIRYLRERREKVKGILITHAHEDHIGALPYVLRDFPNVPIHGTKLSIGLIKTKLREHKLAAKPTFREIEPGKPFSIGAFRCDSYYVCHSIPDAVGVTVETAQGVIVHSGDWKFDHTPVDGRQTDFARLSAIAAKGVLLLLSDSTRAEVPGYTQSEEHVSRTVDNLFKLGADVVYDAGARPHVSGHASQEELKLLLNILQPKHFVPIHGEYRMLVRHARMAIDVGVEPDKSFIITNGDVLEISDRGARLGEHVSSGQVYVDGLGVGDVSQSVMRDRVSIGNEGVLLVVVTIDQQTGAVVAGPDITTRGFWPEHDASDLLEEAKQRVLDGLAQAQTGPHFAEASALKDAIHQSLSSFLYDRTKRRPMVLPVIMQV